MDWLRFALVLLAVAGHINAQQGYNYPKPKTPFPGDTANDSRLPSTTVGQSTSQDTQPQGFDGSQRPFGYHQPSGGYNNGIQSQTPPQPLGGYSGPERPETAGKRPFGSQDTSNGYSNSGQLGSQSSQQSGGYPSIGQTGTPSFRTQPHTESPFLTKQSSTGYPGSSSGTQGSFGIGSSTGTEGPSGTGPSSGSQGPFGSSSFAGTQRPSGIRPTSGTQGLFGAGPSTGTQGHSGAGPSTGSQGPFSSGSFTGNQRPSGTGSTSDTQGPSGAGASVGTEGSLETQPPKYPGVRPTIQDVSGLFSGERRPYEPSSSGSGAPQSPSLSATGRTQYPGQDLNRPSTGRQEGYNYPTPERSFEGNVPTTGISGDSGSGAPFFRQSQSQSPAREGAFEESGLKGTPQSPTGGLNGYSSPVQTRPSIQPSNRFSSSGPQESISSSRPSGVEQQNGYPRSSFSSSTTERQQTLNGYSASERSQGSFPSSRPSTTNQHIPNGYAKAGISQSSSKPTIKYPGIDSQYRGNGQGPDKQGRGESFYEGTPSAQFPVGQGNYDGSESTGFLGRQNETPRIDSTESAGKSGFPERTTGQFPINAPVEGQVIKGHPTSTQGRFPSTSQSNVGPSDYPQIEQRPLSSYLPPGVKGTGELPLSQFPSNGFSQAPSRSQLPSGVSETPRPFGNGFSGSLKPTGELPSGRTSSGAQGSSAPLERSQNGFGSVGTQTSIDEGSSRLHSGLPGQSPRSQNGYDVSGTPTGRGSFETGTPTSSDGSSAQLPSGLSDQSSRSQNGYDVAGRRPFESGTQTGSAIGQGQVQSDAQQGAGRYPTLAKSAQPFVRPGVAPSYSSDEGVQQGFLRPVNGQAFPGFQQAPRDEGNFDEEEEGDYSAIPGQPGRDYPILSDVPETSFNCDDQEYIGYYADVETRCQIFHICANNKTYDFLCPNGTIFHQQNLVCVWWNQFDCETARSLYRVNKDIYELSIVGAQNTGGIPVPGQDYPDLSEGGFGIVRQSGAVPDSSLQRPGGYRSGEGLPGPSGIQISGEYPRGRAQESSGPSSTRYSGKGPQESDGYSSEDSQRPSTRVGGYPNERSQGSTRYSNGKPPGSGGYQGAVEGSQQPRNDGQRPQEYPSRREGQDKYQTLNGDVQRPQGNIGSSYSNGPSVQASGGYPSARQGSAAYPNGQTQGVEEQRPFQKPGNGRFSSETPQGTTGYPGGRPQGAGGSQYPSEEQQRTGTEAQRFGGPEGLVGSKSQSYPSDRPTGPNGSSPAQGPGHYKSEGPSDAPQTDNGYSSESPQGSGQGRQIPVKYGPAERTQGHGVPSLPESGKYPSGTALKPGFRTSAPTSSGSPFPGSAQPHQPTREYLPAV